MNLLDNLAFVYERKADFESAIEVRRLQLDLEKRNWRIHYFLALDLQKLGKSQESKQELRNIVDLKKFMSKEEIVQFQEIERNFGE
jgi:tetratricopeptide (TPR) repeat protein